MSEHRSGGEPALDPASEPVMMPGEDRGRIAQRWFVAVALTSLLVGCPGRSSQHASPVASPGSIPKVQWAGVWELVRAKLGSDGSVSGTPSQLTRVVAEGTAQAQVAVPMSASGLKRLSRGAKPEVVDGKAQISMDLNGTTRQTLTSDFTRPLPVGVKISYELDGQATSAADVAGKAGLVKVTFQLTNVTKQKTSVSFMGFNGVQQEMKLTVPQPIVADLSLTVPEDATQISAPGASMSTSHGGISVSWTAGLFEPMGTTQSFSYQMYMGAASIPKASLLLEVLVPSQTPTGTATDASAKAVAEAQARAAASLAAAQADLTKLQDLQASLAGGVSRSQSANSSARDGASHKVLDSLKSKLQLDIANLGRSAAEVEAGIAEIKRLASSLSVGSLVKARVADALSSAAANLERQTADLVAHASQDLAQIQALRQRSDQAVGDLSAFPSSVTALPEFAQLQADVSAVQGLAAAAQAAASQAADRASALDAAALDLRSSAASLATSLHSLADLAARQKLATLRTAFVQAIRDLVSHLTSRGSNMRSSGHSSALSSAFASRVDAAQAELAAAEQRIHAAEVAEQQKSQAETNAAIAAARSKVASALAAAQQEFDEANHAYAELVALDEVARLHQLPGGNATGVDEQSGIFSYQIAGT